MVHHYFVVPMPFSYEEPAFPTHLKNYFPFLSPWSNNQLDKMYCNNGTNGGGHRIAEPDSESIAQLEKNVHSTLSHLTFPQPSFHLANLRCPTVSVEFKRVAGTTFYSVTVPLGSKNIHAEDLKVTLKDTVVTVEGMKRETKILQKSEFEFQPPEFLGQKQTSNAPNSSSECQTSQFFEKFTKKVTLPPNVNLKKVKVQFSSKGCLKIEAPLIQVQHHHDAKASTFTNSNLTTSTADLTAELNSGDENTRIRHEIAILKI